MPLLLGIDTGGTYTDAVLMDAPDGAATRVLAKAKALTSRPDLALGVAAAIDAVLAETNARAQDIALVSLSTTLATNALVEGQGGRIALVSIGFDPADLTRDGLSEALNGDPVIVIAGGHGHAGTQIAALDVAALTAAIADLPADITGIAVAARFATRNPAHEIIARDLLRAQTGLPVTCSHELSSALGGPKRALTAVLNARLIGMIDRLIAACEGHLNRCGIDARLMVVRGDGALVSAATAREKPIETILSGPAASVAGAAWLTGEDSALVSDIGGTTTDICLLTGGRPAIDPAGARVGPYRTMVEAVAMRTTGLGGDSEVHVEQGLDAGLRLGPRRLMPISLLARAEPAMVHRALDGALSTDTPQDGGPRFAVPLWAALPPGLDAREAAVASRMADGPRPLGDVVISRVEGPALQRLVTRGLAIVAGVTPSDASHVLGAVLWDAQAATKALTLFARQRSGRGDRIAPGATAMARMIVGGLTAQTVACLLEAAFAEDGHDFGAPASTLAAHGLTHAGLDRHRGVIEADLRLGVPLIGLGASAATYYGAVGARLGTCTILPPDGDVANAIGAVVGQVSMIATGSVSGTGSGLYLAHLSTGPEKFGDRDAALDALEAALTDDATARARAAGVAEVQIHVERTLNEVDVEGQSMFIGAEMRVVARGRPRIATEKG